MNEDSPRRPQAALYRIDHDGGVKRMLTDLYTSNGPRLVAKRPADVPFRQSR